MAPDKSAKNVLKHKSAVCYIWDTQEEKNNATELTQCFTKKCCDESQIRRESMHVCANRNGREKKKLNKRSDRITILIIIISVSHVCIETLMHTQWPGSYSLYTIGWIETSLAGSKQTEIENKVLRFFSLCSGTPWAIMYILCFFHVAHFTLFFTSPCAAHHTLFHYSGGLYGAFSPCNVNSQRPFSNWHYARIVQLELSRTQLIFHQNGNISPFNKC